MGKRERALVEEGRRARASCWRALQVKPAAELKVVDKLIERYGIHAFAPVEQLWRGIGRRKVAYVRPIFRGYVFAQLPDERVHLLHDVDGVVRLYSVAGRPVRIDPAFIDKFQRAEGLGAFDKTSPPALRTKLERGALAEIIGGTFGGFIGSVVRLNGQRRVALLITLFGRMTEVEVDARDVMPAAQNAA